MKHPCPACGKKSYWVPEADRLLHADGSESQSCHVSLHRTGFRFPFDRPVTARDLLMHRAEFLAMRASAAGAGTDICLAAMAEEGIRPWMPEHPRDRCTPGQAGVYFVRSGRHVKIGESGNIPSRLRELATGNPMPLRLIGCVPITDKPKRVARERAYHDRWAALRVAGSEWFTWNEAINAWVFSLIESGAAFAGEELTDVQP